MSYKYIYNKYFFFLINLVCYAKDMALLSEGRIFNDLKGTEYCSSLRI